MFDTVAEIAIISGLSFISALVTSILGFGAGVFYFRYFRYFRMNHLDRVTTVATMATLHFTLNIFKSMFFVGTKLIDLDYLLLLTPAYILSIIGTRLGRNILTPHKGVLSSVPH